MYLVKPMSSACFAAFIMYSGVLKSGSPAPKPITEMPDAFIFFAFAVISSVKDGLILLTFLETILFLLYSSSKPAASLLSLSAMVSASIISSRSPIIKLSIEYSVSFILWSVTRPSGKL